MWGEGDFALSDAFAGGGSGGAFEGRSTSTQLKCENAHSPNIYFCVMSSSSDDFRGEVVQCATEGFPPAAGVHCPAEVRELDYSKSDKYILRFDVSVDDVLGVEVAQCLQQLFGDD